MKKIPHALTGQHRIKFGHWHNIIFLVEKQRLFILKKYLIQVAVYSIISSAAAVCTIVAHLLVGS